MKDFWAIWDIIKPWSVNTSHCPHCCRGTMKHPCVQGAPSICQSVLHVELAWADHKLHCMTARLAKLLSLLMLIACQPFVADSLGRPQIALHDCMNLQSY